LLTKFHLVVAVAAAAAVLPLVVLDLKLGKLHSRMSSSPKTILKADILALVRRFME
jgi:hypothetical protein